MSLKKWAASKHINELIYAVQEQINRSSEAIGHGVLQAKESVSNMTEVGSYIKNMESSNQKIDGRIKEIAAAVARIEEDGRSVLHKMLQLSDISKELNEETQQTAAGTEEQYAIMEGLKNDLALIKGRMRQLSDSVNQFRIS